MACRDPEKMKGAFPMEFTIRPVCPEDAADLNAMRRMPGVFENILGLPSERVQKSEDFLRSMGPDQHEFAAVVQRGGKVEVVGSAGLNVAANPRMRHSATFGIMVHRDFQNQGVGTAMTRAVLDLADNWLMLLRVELGVYADNERAIHLYRKFGFEEEGKRRMAVVRNGKYVDELIMARIHRPT
jgi:putative acetyltransferase